MGSRERPAGWQQEMAFRCNFRDSTRGRKGKGKSSDRKHSEPTLCPFNVFVSFLRECVSFVLSTTCVCTAGFNPLCFLHAFFPSLPSFHQSACFAFSSPEKRSNARILHEFSPFFPFISRIRPGFSETCRVFPRASTNRASSFDSVPPPFPNFHTHNFLFPFCVPSLSYVFSSRRVFRHAFPIYLKHVKAFHGCLGS